MLTQKKYFHVFVVATAMLIGQLGSEANAQRRPVQIGGPQGVVIGGGMGFRVGGRNGVQFGGGQGARFGPAETGVQFGAGQGARFGPSQTGVQFGGGQGAKFGSLQFGERATGYGIPASQSVPAGTNNRKVVRAASNASKPVKYSLNGTPFQLRPGRETVLQFNQEWTLTFSPGPGLEDREIPIEEPGTYVFTETQNGWDLVVDDASSQNPVPVNSRAAAVPGRKLEGLILPPTPTGEPILAPKPTDDIPAPTESIRTQSKKITTPTEDLSPPTEEVPKQKTETLQSKSVLEWKSSAPTPARKDK